MKIIKLIDKVEKSKTFWSLLAIFLFFFLLRLPSLIEPNWYGDEGIYQIIGIAINNGSLLYTDIWDNKPPLLYLTYALFQGDQAGVRMFSLVIGMMTVWIFFSLSQKLFNNLRISIIISAIFAFLFGTPFIEGNIANAENFMLLPILLAAIIIYQITKLEVIKIHTHYIKHTLLFCVGLSLGIAFLFKIVAAFDLVAFITFYLTIGLPEKLVFRKERRHLIPVWLISVTKHIVYILSGFLLPLGITTLYFFFHNALRDFFQATFFGNIGYVGYGNKLFIPQVFLILKILILLSIIIFLMKNRKKFTTAALFVIIWLAFSLFNALFSQRPYTHYVLVLLPSFCLLLGLILHEQKIRVRKFFLLLLIMTLVVLFSTFKLTNFKKTFLYYQNAILFVLGQKDVSSYQAFFDGKTPRDYQLASYLKLKNKPFDPLFVWGDSAQIYVLSKTLPITKFTVAYHTRQSKEGIILTQNELNKIRPKYVIILAESPNFPFKLDGYINKFSLDRAIVYEKIL